MRLNDSALRDWQRYSKATPQPHHLFSLADAGRVPKIVRQYPMMFAGWTVDDFYEAELRYWFRAPSIVYDADQLYRVVAATINRRRNGGPDFAESLRDCKDSKRIIRNRDWRMKIVARYGDAIAVGTVS